MASLCAQCGNELASGTARSEAGRRRGHFCDGCNERQEDHLRQDLDRLIPTAPAPLGARGRSPGGRDVRD
ncbi:MAG TPA: hypothetical protein VMK65_07055 [Longimicrobiales bacterium]|nr:hypothetical protein [Longimicrobiales bacterium]